MRVSLTGRIISSTLLFSFATMLMVVGVQPTVHAAGPLWNHCTAEAFKPTGGSSPNYKIVVWGDATCDYKPSLETVSVGLQQYTGGKWVAYGSPTKSDTEATYQRLFNTQNCPASHAITVRGITTVHYSDDHRSSPTVTATSASVSLPCHA